MGFLREEQGQFPLPRPSGFPPRNFLLLFPFSCVVAVAMPPLPTQQGKCQCVQYILHSVLFACDFAHSECLQTQNASNAIWLLIEGSHDCSNCVCISVRKSSRFSMRQSWVHLLFFSQIAMTQASIFGNYSKYEVPPTEAGKPLQIHMTAFLNDIDSFDEITQSFNVEMVLKAQW